MKTYYIKGVAITAPNEFAAYQIAKMLGLHNK
jgi:hypothetical protein